MPFPKGPSSLCVYIRRQGVRRSAGGSGRPRAPSSGSREDAAASPPPPSAIATSDDRDEWRPRAGEEQLEDLGRAAAAGPPHRRNDAGRTNGSDGRFRWASLSFDRRARRETTTLDALVDVLIASEASLFVGTMSSSLGRLVLMLTAARTGRFPPHVPLDPWHGGGGTGGGDATAYASVGWTQLCRGLDYDRFVEAGRRDERPPATRSSARPTRSRNNNPAWKTPTAFEQQIAALEKRKQQKEEKAHHEAMAG